MAWEQIAAQLNSQTTIYSLAVYNSRLYGSTSNNGRLFRLNAAGDAWEQVCSDKNGQTSVQSLKVYGDRLYGGTGSQGRLFRLNAAGNAWEEVCAQLNGQTFIDSLAVYGSRLYGGTRTGGRLFRLNAAGDAWEESAVELNGQGYIFSLAVFSGRLYGGTYNLGNLFRSDVIESTNIGRKVIMSNLKADAFREIPDAFFTSRSNQDGVDTDGDTYIDCQQKTATIRGQRVQCVGIHIGSNTDSAELTTVKLRLKGGNAKGDFNLINGVAYTNMGLDRIYGDYGNASDVKLLFQA